MALVKTEELGKQMIGFSSLPMGRQIGLMIGLAASIALAVSIVLWSQTPSYRMLYGNLSDQEILEISSALDQGGIPYEINETTGAVLVDGGRIHEARMRLAGLGLPKGSGTGYELLEKEQGFGTSQFMETARYQRAIEGELSRTISSLNNVQNARVHLAIPKQSSFVRNKRKPSASVMINLYQGRTIASNQAASITHLVASSIPSLEASDVTVVDQNGRLLTSSGSSEEVGYTSNQFEYQKNMEKYYIKRIEEIVEPIVGVGRVRAQVVADLDFTVTEQTLESYNPDLPSIRSEQTIEEDSTGSSAAFSGVPGALSNQPGEPGTIEGGADNQSGSVRPSKNSSRRIVKNYELDRTISHVRHQTGRIKRLSAAVVIGNKLETDETLSDAELQRVTALIKEAIGFSVARGDSVNVINTAFQSLPEPEPLPETPLLEQPWLWDVLKQALGIGLFLFVIFGVLKPILKSLAEKGVAARRILPSDTGSELAEFGGIPAQLAGPSYEQQIESAKSVAQSEPQRVAQVVKDWVEVD